MRYSLLQAPFSPLDAIPTPFTREADACAYGARWARLTGVVTRLLCDGRVIATYAGEPSRAPAREICLTAHTSDAY